MWLMKKVIHRGGGSNIHQDTHVQVSSSLCACERKAGHLFTSVFWSSVTPNVFFLSSKIRLAKSCVTYRKHIYIEHF